MDQIHLFSKISAIFFALVFITTPIASALATGYILNEEAPSDAAVDIAGNVGVLTDAFEIFRRAHIRHQKTLTTMASLMQTRISITTH